MESAPPETPAQFQTPERPGWVAIALIAAFVLAAVGMFLVGAHLVKRTPGPDLSAVDIVPFTGLTPDAGRQSSAPISPLDSQPRCQEVEVCVSSVGQALALCSKAACSSLETVCASRPASFGQQTEISCGLISTTSRSRMRRPHKQKSRMTLQPSCGCTNRYLNPRFLADSPFAPFLRVN